MHRASLLPVGLILAGVAIAVLAWGRADAEPLRPGPTPPPGVYVFYDWQHLDPQEYPFVGGHISVQWKMLDASRSAYNWGWLDAFLERDAALGKVTGVGIDTYDGPCCGGIAVPDYVLAAQPTAQITCNGEAIPRYWDPGYQNAYSRFIDAFGKRFNGDQRIAFLEIGVGLFGETQPARDEYDDCLAAAGLTPELWQDYVRWSIDRYAEAFPDTPLVLEYAPRYASVCERRILTDYAVARGVGLQHSGLLPDGGSGTVFDDPARDNYGCGQYDSLRKWQGQTVIGWEGTEGRGATGPEATLWRLYNGLDKHPDFILLDAPQVIDPARSAMLDFANQYMGRTVSDAPGVWTALRETEYDWYPQRGNYEYWLYQVHDAPGGRTVPLWRVGRDPEGRYTRRTDEVEGNPYMIFNVDDRYLHGMQEKSVTVAITYLDQGVDTWSLEYDVRGDGTAAGNAGVITKTGSNRWLQAVFEVPDAAFANRLPGGGDLRLDSRGDGDEIIHFVLVRGDERPNQDDAPTPTVTPDGGIVPPPSAASLKVTPTPVPGPWPPPNGVSVYGSPE